MSNPVELKGRDACSPDVHKLGFFELSFLSHCPLSSKSLYPSMSKAQCRSCFHVIGTALVEYSFGIKTGISQIVQRLDIW